MKIHFTGTNWHGGTSRNLATALSKLGHEVYFFEKHDSYGFRVLRNVAMRFTRKPYECENFFYRLVSKKWLISVKNYLPDLIIIEDAPNILAEFIEKARQFGKPIFYYEVSPPHGSGAREVLLSFCYVDEVFCIDREWAKFIFYFFGEKQIYHLPLGVNPDDFYPLPAMEKKYDVIYVASAPEQSPDGLIRAKIINDIPAQYKVAAAGNGWRYWLKYFPKLKKRIVSFGAINAAEVNRLYNQSRISLNFHSTNHTSSVSARIFEAALAGTFQLTDWRDDIKKFSLENYLAIFDNPRQIPDLLAKWLPREEERRKMASGLRDIVFKNHTWTSVATYILDIAKRYAR